MVSPMSRVNEIVSRQIGNYLTNKKIWEVFVNVRDFGAKGDGSDDTDSIQEAFNYAKDKGINVVFFPTSESAYMIDVSKPIFVPSNMLVLGVKGQSVIKVIPTTPQNAPTLPNGKNQAFWGGVNSVFVTGVVDYDPVVDQSRHIYYYANQGENIHFDGLVIDGSGDEVDQDSYTFNKEGNGMAIRGMWTRGFSVTNCEVRNFMGSGIYTYGCTRQTISNNDVHDNGKFEYNSRNGLSASNGVSRNGISLAGGYDPATISQTVPYPYSYDAIVENNIVYDNIDEGIMFGFVRRLLIQGNVVHGNGDRGIEGDTSYLTTDVSDDVNGDVLIISNQVYDHVYAGISVANSNNQKITITDNVVKNCGKYGVHVDQQSGAEVIISTNMIINSGTLVDGTQYHAIYVDADYSLIHGNDILGNTTGSGILVARGITISITGNKIKDIAALSGISVNTFNQSRIAAACDQLLISGNEIHTVKQHGIAINSSSSYKDINQITITGNGIYNYGENSTANTSYGIILQTNVKSLSVVITGNSIVENRASKIGANLIFFQGTTNGNIVSAVITGNELSTINDLGWAAIDGYQYITYPVIDVNNTKGQRIVRATAAPTSGTWGRGDRAINTSPSAGAYFGWVCVSAGTPGTWVPYGQTGALTSVSGTPLWIGQLSVVGGIGYMATGISSSADWKQITN